MIELLTSVLVPLLTETGDPPECEDYPHTYLCEHGEDPDTCFECKEDELAISHAQAEVDWDPEDDPL